MDLKTLVETNKYRNQILEILALTVYHQPVTRKVLHAHIALSPPIIDSIVYLLDSVGLAKTQYAGTTLIVRATEETKLFLEEKGI